MLSLSLRCVASPCRLQLVSRSLPVRALYPVSPSFRCLTTRAFDQQEGDGSNTKPKRGVVNEWVVKGVAAASCALLSTLHSQCSTTDVIISPTVVHIDDAAGAFLVFGFLFFDSLIYGVSE
jgi:hypothetical protein